MFSPIERIKNKIKPKLITLKLIAQNPSLVGIDDVNSPCPFIYTSLKSLACFVPVSPFWAMRKGKLKRLPFNFRPEYKLPPNVASTRIAQTRALSKENAISAPKKRVKLSRLQPIIGQLNVSYSDMHDCFFKLTYTPPLSRLGEYPQAFFERTRSQQTLSSGNPGVISEKLREALGMATDTQPLPFLKTMQKIGLPPGYPGLLVPGINAPLPKGASPSDWAAFSFEGKMKERTEIIGFTNKQLIYLEKQNVDLKSELKRYAKAFNKENVLFEKEEFVFKDSEEIKLKNFVEICPKQHSENTYYAENKS